MLATGPRSNPHVILLAEDEENDIQRFRMALERAHIQTPWRIVRNGEECLAYLEGTGPYAARDEYPLPGLLLLDLKMPQKDGFVVLSSIRRHPTLSGLRVVVLTASNSIFDVNRAYDAGANSFLVKTPDVRDFALQLKQVLNRWLFEPDLRPLPPQFPSPPPGP